MRTVVKGGEPWFVAADVCRALELGTTAKAIERLDTDEKGMNSIHTLGGNQNMTIVSESGLYSLVLGSRKPSAHEFKRWVTHDVIPSIRRHGAYMTPEAIEKVLCSPDTIIKLATELKGEQEKRKQLEAQAQSDRPKVIFADAVSVSESPMLIGELAKVLKQNGVEIGEKRLFEWMRRNGYLISRKGTDYNAPTQRAMEIGLFRVKETAITHSDGHVTVSRTTKVTGRGQQYFINKFLGGEKDATGKRAL